MRFLRDGDGDLWIEVPGQPGVFAMAEDFMRGRKYVERYTKTEKEIANDFNGYVVEWESE